MGVGVPKLLRAYRMAHEDNGLTSASTRLLVEDVRELKAKDLGKFFEKWHELELAWMRFVGKAPVRQPSKVKLDKPALKEDFSWTGGQDEEAAASAGNA